MRRMLCALIGVCWVSGAWAEPQFWIVIGSYQDVGRAEQTLLRADASMDESFAISSVDIQAVRWNRIASGPYLTHGMANLTLIQARQAGFDGAWILVTDSVDQDMESDYGAYDAYASAVDAGLFDYDDSFIDSVSEYPDIESLLPPAVSVDKDDKEKSPPRELTVEVPEGYELHKLRRETD